MPLPYRGMISSNLAKTSNRPFHEKFGAGMYRPIGETYPSPSSKQQATPVKSYSAAVDEEESSNEGISMEYVKSEVAARVDQESNKLSEESFSLDFSGESILQGIIMSEILSKPVSRRKRGR